MENKKFKMLDEEFVCEHCNYFVKPLGYTARDHCPKCLYSKHVDVNPGDRNEVCHGMLVPIGVLKDKKAEFKIVYRCSRCGAIRKNKMANDDDMDLIIKLSVNNH